MNEVRNMNLLNWQPLTFKMFKDLFCVIGTLLNLINTSLKTVKVPIKEKTSSNISILKLNKPRRIQTNNFTYFRQSSF